MAASNLPALPANLKAIQHYMKTAIEHEKRDPVIAYYCRAYAMQRGMQIDKKSPECRQYLMTLMDFLEKVKSSLQDEAIHNELVGQAHVENYALKVFLFADNEDRAGRFNKNVVKSFYTAGMLFDVLTYFGELSEDIENNRKYAKWKAAYIHKCLKNGETPIPGPLPDGETSDEGIGFDGLNDTGLSANVPSSQFPNDTNTLNPPPAGTHAPPTTPQDTPVPYRAVPQQPVQPPQQPAQPPVPVVASTSWIPPPNPTGVSLTPQEYQKAMKFCKHASSALQYEDSQTAITNLQKALQLLTTGKV
ncbi:vacuolar protein sorting-associated protein VTA1 homolog [Gigantopelta aegis]|uniref:vacuolar protein sorting-associated protein VTA1 homolog n=1 Tax=Gigantopelta aegis TaxID=1735272 RepID=UPI001B88A7AD|nr:vacuolar protein sorting-associated protein VTA1 homolog [Gigantopelta aegis]